MIHRCHLNRLNQFSTFLSSHLRNARLHPKLLEQLRSLSEIIFSGLQLHREDEEFAYRNGLKIKVSCAVWEYMGLILSAPQNLFGNTECGAMLLSIGGSGRDAALLRAIPDTSYAFIPIDATSGHQSSTQLLELVILADSGDCPDLSLRGPDGHFHTGDLFQEMGTDLYAFCGRNDDWIKSENSLRCDTKYVQYHSDILSRLFTNVARAIEDNIRATCGDLIEECIVVGTGRPSPALFVEPVAGIDHTKLKREIIRKTRPFHNRRYLHERITSPELIIVVPPKSLPRTVTKGNIRRRAVEEAYQAHLDDIYSSLR